MKKRLIACGLLVLLAIPVAGIALTQNDQTRRIKSCMQSDEPLSAAQQAICDYNHDGKVNTMDLLKAKTDAFLHRSGAAISLHSPVEAKQLGRTAFHEDTGTLWCSLSGSGIAFDFCGTQCSLTLVGDSACKDDVNGARYAVYVNDERTQSAVLQNAEETIILKNPDDTAACSVRIVKLSESMQSSLGIRDILVTPSGSNKGAEPLTAAPKKAHYIEFIGDSITCGYGVDGVYMKDVFKTSNEDATQAYAIRTAEKLEADYSLVSYSGHGIISGYTGDGKLNSSQLVPRYYGQTGHSYGVIEERHKMQDDKWGFETQPDLVVINLGTNDASYTGSDATKQAEFSAQYAEFLKTVREKNPNAPILCTLGIMGTTLCDAIDNAVQRYQDETGDTNINVMRFAMQEEQDGYAVDWHPSAVTHEKAAETLSAFIKDWLKW